MFFEANVIKDIKENEWKEIQPEKIFQTGKMIIIDMFWFNDYSIEVTPHENKVRIIFESDDYFKKLLSKKPVGLKIAYHNELFIFRGITNESYKGIEDGYHIVEVPLENTIVNSMVRNGQVSTIVRG